jgi:EmrB/QacA subfamily drug resistance transporter
MNLQVSKPAVFAVCSMSMLIVGLDATVVNVALPSIGRDLSTDLSGLQWTIDAYTVVLASLLMLAGSLADRFGRKRVFVTGLGVFAFASLLCALAPSVELLVAARALQAVGGSMLNPVAMSIITNTFTEPRERAQAVGVWGAVFGLSLALGPIIGGAVVAAGDWRAIFLLNLPVLAVAIALTVRYVPESRAPNPRRLDPVGQMLVIVTHVTLTYGIIEAPAALPVAGVALLALVAYETRRSEPLIDVRVFRSVAFSSAMVISIAAFAAFGGLLFLNTLYLQGERGLSALETGVATLPLALMIVLVSPLSGRIVGRSGPRVPLLIAGVCMTTACLLLAAGGPLAWLIACYGLFGVGIGFVNAPITNTAVSGLPRAQAGVAAAMATTSRQIGQALGVALGGPWLLLAACGAVVLVLGVLATARRTLVGEWRTPHATSG